MPLEQAIALALTPSASLAAKPSPPAQRCATPVPNDPAGLTLRELDVLRLVANGLTNAQVAGQLVISPRTVDAHLVSIYGKLGVNTRSAATRFALDHDLV
jgi:DNA-binding NarL/FixJ family response regulator